MVRASLMARVSLMAQISPMVRVCLTDPPSLMDLESPMAHQTSLTVTSPRGRRRSPCSCLELQQQQQHLRVESPRLRAALLLPRALPGLSSLRVLLLESKSASAPSLLVLLL